jgi:hypothetical protein
VLGPVGDAVPSGDGVGVGVAVASGLGAALVGTALVGPALGARDDCRVLVDVPDRWLGAVGSDGAGRTRM